MPAAHAVTRGDGVEFRRFFFHYSGHSRLMAKIKDQWHKGHYVASLVML
jgi:hypothetical protein